MTSWSIDQLKEEEVEHMDPTMMMLWLCYLELLNGSLLTMMPSKNLVNPKELVIDLFHLGSFTRDSITFLRTIDLYATFGSEAYLKIIKTKSLLLMSYRYNIIIRCLIINWLCVMILIYCMTLKFWGDPRKHEQYYLILISSI